MLLFLALFVIAAQSAVPSSFDVSGYTNSKVLLTTTHFQIWWNLEADYIDIAFAISQTGWFAFGLANQASIGMIGADIVSMWVDDSGEAIVVDRSTGYDHVLPKADKCQDWKVRGASRDQGWQFVELRRWRDTGDAFQDKPIITGFAQAVIFAFGGNGNNDIAYHGSNHYQAKVNWLASSYVEPIIPADAYTVDFRMNAHVPTDTTTYRCRSFNMTKSLKNPAKKVQIVKFEAILDFPEVHHILIRKCVAAEGFWQYYHDNPGETCWGHFDVPPELAFVNNSYRSVALASPCGEVLYSWTVGNLPWELPNEVGFPTEGNELFLLEIHYNNYKHTVVPNNDTTALRLTFTETLRTYECAYTVGADPIVFLPPLPAGIPWYQVPMSCPGECTIGFPGPITIFAVQLHAHSYARGASMAVYRGGRFIADVISTSFYKFDNQNTVNVVPVVVQPGDDIIFTCAWDTTSASKPVVMSENSYDEMCGILFFWYPRRASSPTHPLAAGMPACGQFYGNGTVCGYGPMMYPQPFIAPSVASKAEETRLAGLRYRDWSKIEGTCRADPPMPEPEPEPSASSTVVLVGYLFLAIFAAWTF